ncbi:MAG: response regulator transcription factor [Thermoguttaceae bacterium]
MAIENMTRNRSGKSRVLLVDDHPLVRRGVADVIAHENDMEVCGEAADVAEAMQEVERTQPDLVLVDLALRSGHGLELIEKIKARNPQVRTLVSSMHDETLFAERVLQAGAMGYITKQEPPEMLVRAVRQVLRGEVYLSQRMTSRLLHRVAGGGPPREDAIQNLSNREVEVYEMIGQGLTVQQIAVRLHLSPKTVETHREKIKQKLNLKSSAELSRRAVQWVLERGWSTSLSDGQ